MKPLNQLPVILIVFGFFLTSVFGQDERMKGGRAGKEISYLPYEIYSGNVVENETRIRLKEPDSGVLLNLDKFYSICRSRGCVNAQIVRVFGLNKGKTAIPIFFLNPGNEELIAVSENTLEIKAGTIDDVLVYFPDLVEEIVIVNGKKYPSKDFSVFLEIGQAGVVETSGLEMMTLMDAGICELKTLDLFLDNSSSMNEGKRQFGHTCLMRFLEMLKERSPNIEVDISYVFSLGSEREKGVFPIQDLEE
ncbi:MAG: hypothetical protein IPJ40_03370 [Saprospirales bacterium]|nr:hypothetical protein [Saprospirales bacterium]